ncbi:MAG: glycosyltransferase family 4 protein [Planctomycetota bacterium]
MIRLESINARGVSPNKLPPARREGPVRALFLATTFLGFKNYDRIMRQYVAEHDGIDGVFVEIARTRLMTIAGKSIPGLGGWDQHAYRYLWMWRKQITGWLRGPLPIDRFDVIHVITQGSAGSVLDFRDKPTKWAVNLDAAAAQSMDTYGYPALGMRPMINAENKIYAAADLAVCRNRWCGEWLREHQQLPDDKIHVCRNSMHPPPAHRAQHPPRAAGEKVRLVFVGNDFIRKGGPELLKMHQERFADVAELHVCSRRAVPDHAAKNVVWHGAVDRETLIGELLPTMDVFIMPTRNDMHPWAILEAASIGLPVISTDFAGIPEMIVDGHNGYLCGVEAWSEVADRLATLIENHDLRWQMGLAGRERVAAEYNPDRQFGGLIDRLYELGDSA